MIPNSDHSSTPLTREQVEFVRSNLDVVVGPSLKRQAQHFADTALHLYDENAELRKVLLAFEQMCADWAVTTSPPLSTRAANLSAALRAFPPLRFTKEEFGAAVEPS